MKSSRLPSGVKVKEVAALSNNLRRLVPSEETK
jgi:hypothetical protein